MIISSSGNSASNVTDCERSIFNSDIYQGIAGINFGTSVPEIINSSPLYLFNLLLVFSII